MMSNTRDREGLLNKKLPVVTVLIHLILEQISTSCGSLIDYLMILKQ